jgi:hypothetical protein
VGYSSGNGPTGDFNINPSEKGMLMKVLIACEFSGRVRDAFIKRGFDAMSCDFLPTDMPGPHYQGNVFDIIDDGWDLMIAHPPCTYLAASGSGWLYNSDGSKNLERWIKRSEAIKFVKKLLGCKIKHIALENPVGFISTEIRKPDQYIHPYYFGDRISKKTGLWLKDLPLLEKTNEVEPEWIYYKGNKGRRCSPDHYKTAFKINRRHLRSITYQGIADAMADQWGSYLKSL